jgi:mono/diheme cytochrome c family protein
MRQEPFVRAAALALALTGCQGGGAPGKSADSAAPAASLSQSDQLLLAAAKVALPPPGVAPGDLPDPSSRGAQLLVQYCAQCHALPAPTTHSLTDWPSVARRMWLRMEWLPPALGVKVPTTADRFVMLEYLTANALKVSGAVLPVGRGRDQFAVVCSQCHALPDPRVHSPEDWPTVYARMERNMERMLVRPPKGDASTEILMYLQTVAGKKPAARR